MRKGIAWMLCALLLTMGALPACAAGQPDAGQLEIVDLQQPTITNPLEGVLPDTIGIQSGMSLVVGSTIQLSGKFTTTMWGTNTADMDVRALLHSYETVVSEQLWESELNGIVVRNARFNAEGADYAYTIELQRDLQYNDGSPITAQDYVFAILLAGAPEVKALGGTTLGMSHVKGYDAYSAGETRVIEGVRLLSDYEFQLRISGSYYPYFYNMAMLAVQPYPMKVIAPGCEVRDDGQGAYLAASDAAALMDITDLPYTPGEFSVAMLQKTMLDPVDGYLTYPKVTSGPYSLESYDPVLHEAKFLINPYFKGDFHGQKPHIERLTFRQVEEQTELEELKAGTVDLVNKSMDDGVVGRGLEMIAGGDTSLRAAEYPRSGLSFLAFACELAPTDSVAVRKAISMSVDKNEVILKLLNNTATRVDGYYGVGQWMMTYEDTGSAPTAADPKAVVDPATVVEPISVPEILTTRIKEVDLLGAQALLAQDGWTLNADGQPFVAGRDMVRYRQRDGALEPLTLKMAATEGNAVAANLREQLERVFQTLGIGLEVTELPFSELLMHYYRQVERTYHMFFMASNLSYVFDPYYTFHTGEVYQGMLNTSGLKDERLMSLARSMRETTPMDLRTYVERWLQFQNRFDEVMPLVPIYSNEYYDFYRSDLQRYSPYTSASWAQAILPAYIGEPIEPEVDPAEVGAIAGQTPPTVDEPL
jgi:ABC-type transport system substrate-binding protein